MQKNAKLLQISISLATMVRGKPICNEIRALIRDYFKTGKTVTEISKQLNLSKSSVHGVIKVFKTTGNIENNIKKRGRTSAITPRDKRELAKIVKADRRQSLRNLTSEWSQKIGKTFKRKWTWLQLKNIGYGFYKVCFVITSASYRITYFIHRPRKNPCLRFVKKRSVCNGLGKG